MSHVDEYFDMFESDRQMEFLEGHSNHMYVYFFAEKEGRTYAVSSDYELDYLECGSEGVIFHFVTGKFPKLDLKTYRWSEFVEEGWTGFVVCRSCPDELEVFNAKQPPKPSECGAKQ